MNKKQKLRWFDRMLLKIVVAKALARHCENLSIWCRQAREAFDEINLPQS